MQHQELNFFPFILSSSVRRLHAFLPVSNTTPLVAISVGSLVRFSTSLHWKCQHFLCWLSFRGVNNSSLSCHCRIQNLVFNPFSPEFLFIVLHHLFNFCSCTITQGLCLFSPGTFFLLSNPFTPSLHSECEITSSQPNLCLWLRSQSALHSHIFACTTLHAKPCGLVHSV